MFGKAKDSLLKLIIYNNWSYEGFLDFWYLSSDSEGLLLFISAFYYTILTHPHNHYIVSEGRPPP